MPAPPTRKAADQRGFTLVELLVVMLVIALLAAIAIPSFLGQREKAHDAEAKAAVRTAATAMATWASDQAGEYSGATVADLRRIEETLSGADLAIVDAGASSFEVAVTSSTANVFTIARRATGRMDHICTDPGRAGCPPGGIWE